MGYQAKVQSLVGKFIEYIFFWIYHVNKKKKYLFKFNKQKIDKQNKTFFFTNIYCIDVSFF